MKRLPSILAVSLFAITLRAQTPAPKSEESAKPQPTQAPAAIPQPKAAGDPFVKGADGDKSAAVSQNEESPEMALVFDVYSLNRNDAAALFASEPGSIARYRRVLEMEKAGRAHLQTLSALTTRSGQRALIESIEEVRYATAFGPTPMAWETRNAGDTFEVEPVVGPDGKICDINLVPTRINLEGFRDDAGATDDSPTSQPVFHTQKITTSVAAMSGEPFYLGTFTPPPVKASAQGEASAEVWLAFLHAKAKQLPPTDPKKPFPDGPVMVSLIYSCYSLERDAARDILVTPSSADAPWEKVEALLAEKKAQLEFVTSVRSKSGQRAVTEEVQEVRYMTEYTQSSQAIASESGAITNSKGETSNLTISHTPPNAQRIPGYASKFDTRNAGITVEFEPAIRPDGQRIELNEVVQNVGFLGMLKVPGIGGHYPSQPLFQTSKVTTTQMVLSGKTAFVSTLNPPGADGVNGRTDTGRTWLLFVHAAIDLY